ncbi:MULTISPECIES: gas vesicle protein K [unclassified Streptomyces]|uniref:gas vesicle protein K n=1 Tax=unclassified Streptomyces TaxID=2593676 RepID=UPI002E16E4CB
MTAERGSGVRTASLGPEPRLDLDPEHAARDLAGLVLTVVELLRQLMERQAVRRFDDQSLTPEQEERMGTALMLLDERMDDLCARHGLKRSDLNLDLGPLGSLLPDAGHP